MRLILLGVLWLLASAAVAQPAAVRVCFIDQVNVPLVLDPHDPAGEHPGLTLELLRRIQARTGVPFDYHAMPWARCLHLLQNNEMDAVFHASFRPERMELGVYPMRGDTADSDRRLVSQSYYIYTLRNAGPQWDGKRFSDLQGPVGVVIDFSAKQDLEDMGLAVETAPDTLTNLRKLAAGRIAAVVNYASQTDTVVAAHPDEFNRVVKLEPPFKEKTKYLVLSHGFYRQHTELAEQIWDELARMQRSGEYAAIEATYAAP
jgi:polar amino acid transport system substrate-binding protein